MSDEQPKDSLQQHSHDDSGECLYCERASELAPARGSARPDIYVFHRAEGFYPLELKDDSDAIRNAECNPGTLKVTTKSGRPVWPNDQAQALRREPKS